MNGNEPKLMNILMYTQEMSNNNDRKASTLTTEQFI